MMMMMMASLKTSWIQSILLLTLFQCCDTQGPPSPPSDLQCSKPCDETECSVDIHCVWDGRSLLEIPTNFTLYWKYAHSRVFNASCGSKSNGLILREHFKAHEQLNVWVQAESQYGFSQSQELIFNPKNILKPPPPKFSSSYLKTLEINWSPACKQLDLSPGPCEVRYRTENDVDWQKDDELDVTYTFTDAIPGAVYEFQLRCCCDAGPFSDWSPVHRIKSAESAPIGVVDVWRDCGISPTSTDCYLTWKRLPASLARGPVLTYEITLLYMNGSIEQMNASTANSSRHFASGEEMWFLRSPLKNVSSVSVTAFNSFGATAPAFLAMPLTGKEGNDEAVKPYMNEENLTVNLDLPSQLVDRENRFLVQYKEAEQPAGQGFDWRMVSRSKTVRFTGWFKKYTPYQVTLFQILNTGEVQHISSVVVYSVQKAPSAVPSFNVVSIEETEVTVQWEPVPLRNQNGQILYYLVGIDSEEVHNVSVSSQHNNKKSLSLKLQRLQPAQEYEVWVRAVNAAGRGPSVTARFTTQHSRNFDLLFAIVVGVLLVFFVFSAVLIWLCHGKHKLCRLAFRGPDPRRSHILKEIKHQIHDDTLAWMCIPIPESYLIISQLEIQETKLEDFDTDRCTHAGTGIGCLQINCLEDETEDAVRDRKDCRYNGKDYSKMVDSDEDRKSCCSSSEEELHTSDYEKRFMPTAADLLAL
ncbi:interleukin-6 receptor subunit beta-like [Gouania willdenowi]|uniref:Interleukin-6 receptor subunit beta-like n=1 Tax=Gouania willdenowi TaxID=441366 RepID=A0A8C5E0N7_GOUWI|nr:interleukin-6 receptor subunit beta-like [Gouania willdenowi]